MCTNDMPFKGNTLKSLGMAVINNTVPSLPDQFNCLNNMLSR